MIYLRKTFYSEFKWNFSNV